MSIYVLLMKLALRLSLTVAAEPYSSVIRILPKEHYVIARIRGSSSP